MKIKVLHSVLSMETGGLENGIVNLMNGASENFQVDVLCLRARGELAERVSCANQGEQRVFFDGDTNPSILTAIKKTIKTLKFGGYHVLHTHGWTTLLTGYIAAKMSGTFAVIHGEHGTLYFDHWRRKLLQKSLFRLVDLNLTVSAALANQIQRELQLSARYFLPIINGVDTERFYSNQETRKKMRDSLGISRDALVVGTIGRLVPVKNYQMLIDSTAQLIEKLSHQSVEILLVFCGDGSEREALTRRAKEVGLETSVRFLGRRSDTPDVLNAFDIFTLTSLSEGLPNTLLEAMATGLPSLVTDVGGSGEVSTNNKTGFLVPSEAIDAFTEKLELLCLDAQLRKTMGHAARTETEEKFSLPAMVDNYEAAYRQVLAKHKLVLDT